MAAHMHFQSELNQIQVSEAQVNWIKLPIQVQWKLALDWIKIIHKQTKPKATLKKKQSPFPDIEYCSQHHERSTWLHARGHKSPGLKL